MPELLLSQNRLKQDRTLTISLLAVTEAEVGLAIDFYSKQVA